MAKTICILTEAGNRQFTCYGNFKEVCKHFNLPYSSLRVSHTHNGRPIFQTKRELSYAKKYNFEKYIGWSAVHTEMTPELALDAMVLENELLGLYD